MACSHAGLVASVVLRSGRVSWQTRLPGRVEASPVYDPGNDSPLRPPTEPCTVYCRLSDCAGGLL